MRTFHVSTQLSVKVKSELDVASYMQREKKK